MAGTDPRTWTLTERLIYSQGFGDGRVEGERAATERWVAWLREQEHDARMAVAMSGGDEGAQIQCDAIAALRAERDGLDASLEQALVANEQLQAERDRYREALEEIGAVTHWLGPTPNREARRLASAALESASPQGAEPTNSVRSGSPPHTPGDTP
jgi:hypothetical protein